MNLKDRIININPDKINLYSEPPNWWWFNPINKKIMYLQFLVRVHKFFDYFI